MTTFTIKNISAGIQRGTHTMDAETLTDVVKALEGKLVNSCPGWAYVQYGETGSAEITWNV